ncbi:hypothetical protein ACIBG8_19395 [Nonomuraea sp. NPDC050556]|uniref:hypothetical protein n=1 Tax=Nonomuraea sp. NPDC050556 TaxID=3364369 RepID=UPI0037A282B1
MGDLVILSPAGGVYTLTKHGWADTPDRWREAVHYGSTKLAFDEDGNRTSRWGA